MAHLFRALIENWESWSRVFDSIPAFEPLARQIYRREGISFPGLQPCTPGTNAVFRCGDTVIKIFVPPDSGWNSEPDFYCEVNGMQLATRQGIPAPALLAVGEIHDRYLFRYLIMTRLKGLEFNQIRDTLTRQEKQKIGRRMREITALLHQSDDPELRLRSWLDSADSPRWLEMPERFRAERRAWLAARAPGPTFYVHGDLTGENVLIDARGDVALLDFADARRAPEEYEDAIVAAELFRFDPHFLTGCFHDLPEDSWAEHIMNGLLIHEFGSDCIRQRLFPVAPPQSLSEVREALAAAFQA